MRFFKKALSFFMSLVMMFSVVFCCNVNSSALSIGSAFDSGLEVMPTQKFFDFLGSLDSVVFKLFGFHFLSPEKLEIELDSRIADVCEYIEENSGMNVLLLSQELFSSSKPYLDIAEKYGIDVQALHAQLISASDKLLSEGQGTLSAVFYWFAVFCGNLDKITVSCVETGENNVYELFVTFRYVNGDEESFGTGIYYNTVSNRIYGKDETGILGLGYDFDVTKLMIYVPVKVWMREFGFCSAYDLFCYTTGFFNYSTQRIKFSYDGRDWMIQLWKGRYLISNGAEIGIYNKPKDRLAEFYDCAQDSDMLNMSMSLYHGDDLLMKRDETLQWWLCGFGLSNRVYLPQTLTVKGTITLKDEKMLESFIKALDNNGKIEYTFEGLNVSFVW